MTISATKITALDFPVGSIAVFAGSSVPTGWLLCDGAAVSRTTYAGLFAVISTTYGAGDGSSTFNVPDLRDRLTLGKSGSTSLAQTNKGVTAAAVLDASSLEGADHTHTATTGNVSVDHDHTMTKTGGTSKTSGGNSVGHTHAFTTGGQSATHTHDMGNHTHLTPDLVLNYMIKT